MAKYWVIHTQADLIAASVWPWIIVTGKYFEDLKDDQARAVISHEIGHLKKHHAIIRIWWLLSLQWRNIAARCRQQEMDADEYAVRDGHGNGLISFLLLVKSHISPLHPTHVDRMKNIHRVIGELHGK